LGVLIFQDLAVIPILLMLTILSDSSSTISSMLVDIAIAGFILAVVMIIFGKYFLDFILKIVDRSDTHELFIMVILVIAIGSSYLAHALGFTYSLGAFIGGMLIAETHYRHQIEADLIPFRDLFLALFFVTVGMQIDIHFFVSHILEVFSFSLIIMLIKGLIIFGVIYSFSNKTVALQTSLAISQVGEFSFVVFTQATQSNLLDSSTGQLLTLSVIVSMILTPFILKNIPYLVNIFFNRKIVNDSESIDKHDLEDHVVVCGYGSFGKQIISNLKEYSAKHIVIIDNYDFFEKAINNGEKAIFGNPSQKSILEEAGLKKAKVVIIAVHDVEQISLISHSINSVNKDVKIIAKVTNKDIFEQSINTKDFVDIYSFTAGLIATQTFGYLNEDNL
jgi:CPA2 family monovalent cation:H+ antiporter-2